MDDLYTTADFLGDVTVAYWEGAYADELMAIHFGWSIPADGGGIRYVVSGGKAA